jgi:hypothetical protein
MTSILITAYALIALAFGTLAYQVETDGWIPLKVLLTGLFWPIYLAIAFGAALAEVGKELQAKNKA